MPGLGTSAYSVVGDVTKLARALVNDARIVAGDVLTDTAPFTMQFVNDAYSNIQFALANAGYEEFYQEAWITGIPAVPFVDPATRVILDDSGLHIVTVTGVGSSNQNPPQLPTDLLAPLLVWERITGSTNIPSPLVRPKDGLAFGNQGGFLKQWDWVADGLRFIGATQVMDILLRYTRQLASVAQPTDPVPIRGVQSAVAYYVAAEFVASRSPEQSAIWTAAGDEQVEQFKIRTARAQQRTSHRRRPYSYRSRRTRNVF